MRLKISFLFQNKLLVSCPLSVKGGVLWCFLAACGNNLSSALSLSFFLPLLQVGKKILSCSIFHWYLISLLKVTFFWAINFSSKVWLCLTFLHFILIDIFQFFLFSSLFLVCVLGLFGWVTLIYEFTFLCFSFRIFQFQRIFLRMTVWSFALKVMVAGINLSFALAVIGTLSVIQQALTLKQANGSQWVTFNPLIKWLCQLITIFKLWCSFPIQIRLPFSSLRPIFRARTVSDAPPFDPTNVLSLQACFL